MIQPTRPDHQPWFGCNGYVYRRHMLKHARLEGGRIVTNACDVTDGVISKEALDWIYELLSALDSKASALMRLNGVMLAAAAFLLSAQPVLKITKWDFVLIVATAAASAFSILLCLMVVNVQWYFLGRVTDAGGKLDYTEEFEMLQSVGYRRQTHYRIAWQVSRIAAILFVVEFVRQLITIVSGWSPW
jgi:hypothetical protein